MMLRNTQDGYGIVARLLHWLLAGLLFVMFGLGWYITGLSYYDPFCRRAFDLHRSLGMVTAVLVLIRIVWVLVNTRPRLPQVMPQWERAAARAGHVLLYVLMVLAPVSGYLLSTADGNAFHMIGVIQVPALFGRIPGMTDAVGYAHYLLAFAGAWLVVIHTLARAQAPVPGPRWRAVADAARAPDRKTPPIIHPTQENESVMSLVRYSLLAVVVTWLPISAVLADRYRIDPEHSFIEFSTSHLGFGLLRGRFNEVAGQFTYDPDDTSQATAEVTVATRSLDSNHAERDRHLRSSDFLDASNHPQARFVASTFEPDGDGGGRLRGELTLRGVTLPLDVELELVGIGEDPWGGHRIGFVGRASFQRSDFGIDHDLGPEAEQIDLGLFIEGIRQ